MQDIEPTNFTELSNEIILRLQRLNLIPKSQDVSSQCKEAYKSFDKLLSESLRNEVRADDYYHKGFIDGSNATEREFESKHFLIETRLSNLKNMTVLELANWLCEDN